MTKSKSIIKDAAQFTVSGYISSICNFISAIVVRKILSPFFMGIYAELLLVFEYAKYSHLGIIDSLDRQIPYYNGRKEYDKVEESKNTAICFSFITAISCALGIITFSYFFGEKISPQVASGLKVIALMVVLQSVSTFYVTLVRTHHLFGPLSRYVVLIGVCDVVFKALLGLKFGVIGILWASVFTLAVGMFFLYKNATIQFRRVGNISMRSIKNLLGIGFPLLLSGFTFMALRSVDRIMIIAFLTKEDLGFYSIAIMMYSFVFQLPNLIYTVLFPRFYETFGSTGGDVEKMRSFLEKPTLAFAYLFPILVGIAVILMPIFINYVLPNYVRGITPALILLFGTIFISLTNMSGYLLVALKRQSVLVLVGVLCTGIGVLLNFLLVKVFQFGINGIAAGTAITYFLYSIFIIGYAMAHYIKGFYSKARLFLNLYLPTVGVFIVFLVLSSMFKYDFTDFRMDFLKGILEVLLFAVATFPLLLYANRKLGLLHRIKDANLFNISKK